MTAEQIAAVAHAAHRALCEAHGDRSHPQWYETTTAQRQALIEHTKEHLRGDPPPPQESHMIWCRQRWDAGWSYGPVRDKDKKQHPCLVPYRELPPHERAKDDLFAHVVKALRPFVR